MSASTERRFLSSTVASYFSLGTRLLVAFATRMILARLLVPEAHGLYEQALRAIILASAVRDLGLNFQLMRDRRKPYGTVLAFSLVMGVLVALGLFLAAPLFAFLTPELPALIRAMAVWVILDGIVVAPRTFFERELRIGRLVMPEIGRGLVAAAVSLTLAWLGWGVWSLVAGELAAAAVFATAVWMQAWRKVPLVLEPELIVDLMRRSRVLFLVWIVLQLVAYIDIYIIETFAATATVGQYARAYGIVFLVPVIMAPRALLPALVEYRDRIDRFFEAFRFATVILCFSQVTAGYFLFFNAEKVVAILLGPQWGPAVPLLRILCFVPFLDLFAELGGEVLKVRDEDRLWLLCSTVNLVSLVVFGTWFTHRWGAAGMAWANFLPLGNLLMAWRMSQIFSLRIRRLVTDLVLLYTVPLPFFLIAAAMLAADSWPRFIASFAATGVAGSLLALRFYSPFRDFLASRKKE